MLLSVAFARHLPDEKLTAFLNKHRDIHAQRLIGYLEQLAKAESADEPDPYRLATLDFGLTCERAVLDYFDRLPPTMTRLDQPVSSAAAHSRQDVIDLFSLEPRDNSGTLTQPSQLRRRVSQRLPPWSR